ncbi:hypothetical protein LUZ60_012555 [Juncus effusus]|nr:hypothetical protein LUZ60_012555 [Juncus effusus]
MKTIFISLFLNQFTDKKKEKRIENRRLKPPSIPHFPKTRFISSRLSLSLPLREKKERSSAISFNSLVGFCGFEEAMARFAFGLVLVLGLMVGIISAQAPAPAPLPQSDGVSIDQGIAYMLMLVALVLTYLIHPLDASSPYKLF